MDEGHQYALILDRLGRIETRMDADKADASESRRRVHEKLEQQGLTLVALDHRMAAVEKSVDSAAPTLSEFAQRKAQAQGAGMLGRALWYIGGWLLGGAAGIYALRDQIYTWWHWVTMR